MKLSNIARVNPKTGALIAGFALLAKDAALTAASFVGAVADVFLRILAMLALMLFMIALNGNAGNARFWLEAWISASFLIGVFRGVSLGMKGGCGLKGVWELASGKADFLEMGRRLESKPDEVGKAREIAKSAGYLLLGPGLLGRMILIGAPVQGWMAGRAIAKARRMSSGSAALAAGGKAAGSIRLASRMMGKVVEAASERGAKALSRLEKERLDDSVPTSPRGNERGGRGL